MTVGRADTDNNRTHAQAAHARMYPGVSVFAHTDFDSVIVTDAAITIGNVVPFRREGVRQAAPIEVTPSERPTLQLTGLHSWRRGAAILAVSLLAHGAVLAAFIGPAPPKASIGMEVITVELVLGADTNAGLATIPSPSEDARNSVAAEANSAPQVIEETKQPDPEAEAVSKPQVIEEEAPQQVVKEPEPKPEPPRPRVAETKPKQATPAPKPEPRKERKTTQSPVNSVASTASSGIGRGSSESSATYRGMVAAHLARYKQFPPDAQRLGNQGNPAVSFKLDGSGRVISARLARSSGIDSLDREVVAMVNRASPFPAPPDGRPQSFTVPVSFQISGR